MEAEDVLSTVEDSVLTNYIQLLKELPTNPRRYMFGHLAIHFLQNYGWLEDDKEYKETLKQSFYDGVMDSIDDMNYDTRNLFTLKIRNWLRQTYSSEELEVFKEKLCKTRNNINSTIEAFPV